MLRIAIIGAVLDEPESATHKFNEIVAHHKSIVIGRMGIPLNEEGISVISITVKGSLDEINSFTGLLGRIQGVTVKTSISKKELK
jgi:putative iron-only hydrogenase system regulator